MRTPTEIKSLVLEYNNKIKEISNHINTVNKFGEHVISKSIKTEALNDIYMYQHQIKLLEWVLNEK